MAPSSAPSSLSADSNAGDKRQAPKGAGTITGLNALSITNEPTRATIAYGPERRLNAEMIVLIFDHDGGVSLIDDRATMVSPKSTPS